MSGKKAVKRTKPAHVAHKDNHKEQAAKNNEIITDAQAFTAQLICDLMVIALHDKYGFGYERCKKVTDEISENYSQYRKIWTEDTQDREYAKEVIDRRLKAICGDKFQPWEVRYSV